MAAIPRLVCALLVGLMGLAIIHAVRQHFGVAAPPYWYDIAQSCLAVVVCAVVWK